MCLKYGGWIFDLLVLCYNYISILLISEGAWIIWALLFQEVDFYFQRNVLSIRTVLGFSELL